MMTSKKINELIDNYLIQENEKRDLKHKSSNKLTASFLYKPKRFQLLKYLGVDKKKPDTYSLRKFERGEQIEKAYLDKLAKLELLKDRQIEIEYRGVMGVLDALVNHKRLGDGLGTIPHEVKSVTAGHFKWLKKADNAPEGYVLQGGLYALATKRRYFSIDCICSDDQRELFFINETSRIKRKINNIIDEFEEMLEKKTIPQWEVKAEWQNNPDYMDYDLKWVTYNEAEFRRELKKLGIDY
jgi:hypothetical protein